MYTLLAVTGTAGEPPVWLTILPWIAIFAVFWFLMIRPQMRQQKAHQEKVAGLKKGDEVVTAGGLVGKITKVEEQFVELELAKGMKVRAVKHTIGEVLSGKPAKPAND
ncbi:preprotein translocase subunit YajC [Qipengyuania sp. 1NDH17]|uniref:Sec translocon accessory complex subunit YajC n=1 Tax=Qipengyuania polymorpha TaxID=2867234 RepID=A0ABS7IWV5_9SPHN|nr:preprotein translocase subunit YajC [Qipengyuania polymorpha]MBX7456882.1 preprotein translocase subunit YajC [Qipengyuania polymorpha]